MMDNNTRDMDLYQQGIEKYIPCMKNASDTMQWKSSVYCSY